MRPQEPSYKISYKFRRVLVPVDGSESSMLALEFALDMAMRYGSKVTVLFACPENEKELAESVRKNVAERAARYNTIVDLKIIRFDVNTDSPASVVVKEALEGGYDAVVLGARGRSVSEDLLIGSVALAVVTHVPSTVILIR